MYKKITAVVALMLANSEAVNLRASSLASDEQQTVVGDVAKHFAENYADKQFQEFKKLERDEIVV